MSHVKRCIASGWVVCLTALSFPMQASAAIVSTRDAMAPAGGDVLGVLFAVFIILLVTDILGLTKVFPFTRSVR